MTSTTDEFGRQNVWAKEPAMYVDPEIEKQMSDNVFETHNEKAEKLNGRIAMISLMLAFASYATTGTIAWGLF